MIKPETMWGITYRNGRKVMPDTIRRTRKEAQKACCDNRYQYRDNSDDWKPEWVEWRKAGCRAIKVTVSYE